MIRITISSDAKGHGNSATLIASILRRTAAPVHVRCWCRGYLPGSFESGRLKVEFFGAEEEVTGRYPGHVNAAVFDRLRVIRDGKDWDRCLVMDHDMIALCDLAPYFVEDFEGNLLMGRLFGPGNTLGLQMRQRGGLPEDWRHAEDHPYFFMGPMINLTAMRAEGTWETLLAAHAAIGQDEQLSLTAACGGRTKGVGKQWNLVPQWDHLAEAEPPPSGHTVIGGIPWKNGVPQGIIHWTGPSKPWHRGTKVWRADLWEGERASWEHLRAGIWEKPLAVEVEPENGFGVRALARRGWRVAVIGERFGGGDARALDGKNEAHPDVSFADGAGGFEEALSGGGRGLRQPDSAEASRGGDAAATVRFGSGTRPGDWLEPLASKPEYLALRGPVEVGEVRRLRELGYGLETRLEPGQWPTGGPAPRVLDFEGDLPALAVAAGEELYLKWGEVGADALGRPERSPAAGSSCDSKASGGNGHGHPVGCCDHGGAEDWPWKISEASKRWLREHSGSGVSTILELGTGNGTGVLAESFPAARILSLEHHAGWFGKCLGRLGGLPNVTMVHAPIDGTLPWYDCREIDFEPVDLLFISGPEGPMAQAVRAGAPGLRSYLKEGARVVLDGMDATEKRTVLSRWLGTGGLRVEMDEPGLTVLEVVAGGGNRPSGRDEGRNELPWAEKVYVISLPEREDRREEMRKNWEPLGLEFEVIEGVRPEESDIRWEEMKGMEAYGKADNLRGRYIPGAVGCKRAGIKALRTFLDSGAATALICQDDCLWKPDAARTVARAMRELPDDWDLLYFSASSREKNTPHSPHLVRLGGARFCNAILWTRAAAERLLPDLERCDCEWDLFMQRSHASLRAFCVVPMPAYQGKSHSDIVRSVVQPPNR
jgi:hypothetical protein